MQGSKQAPPGITSEQRTEIPGDIRLRRVCPLQRVTSAAARRNKSGTAEVIRAFVSYLRDKGVFSFSICCKEDYEQANRTTISQHAPGC